MATVADRIEGACCWAHRFEGQRWHRAAFSNLFVVSKATFADAKTIAALLIVGAPLAARRDAFAARKMAIFGRRSAETMFKTKRPDWEARVGVGAACRPPLLATSCKSSDMKARIPVHAMFCERVDDGKQLAHSGNQRDFLSLAHDIQALVVGAQHRVMSHRGQRRHVERAATRRRAHPRWFAAVT